MSGAKLNRFRVMVGIGFAMALALPSSAAAGGLAPVDGPAAALDAPPNTTSWIVTYKSGVDTSHSSTFARNAGGHSGQVFKHAIHGFVFHGSAIEAAKLKKNPFIRTIVPNGKITIATDPIQTGVSRIRANHLGGDSAFAAGFTGQGVKVAVLDTGVDLTHPDLVPNLDIALGKNCITTGPPQDGHGHGTHVAGIIAAADNGIGVIGVAPKATIVPIKVLDDTGNGQWSNLICAVDYLTGLMTDGDPTNDVRVANMSLGDVGGIGTCTDGSIRQAICTSVAAGVTYVAAAGNSTVDASTFIPAAFPEVIAVSALTDLDGEPGGLAGCYLFVIYCDDTLAEFSNFGSTIAVAAPGTQIYSDWTGGGYATEDGTSMASPHVAGTAALVLQANPSLSPADIRAVLTSTGECPDGTFADTNGHGNCVGEGQWGNDPDGIAEPLVNALHAVEGASGDRLPTVSITAPVNGATVTGPVAITANAADDHGVTKVDFSVNGVPIGTDTNGADGWTASWDASSVDQGSYSIAAKATDTAGQTSISRVTVVRPTNIQGTWVGKYGSDGYILGNWNGSNSDLSSLPAGVTYNLTQGARATWVSPTTDVRALTDPAGVQRRSQTFYDLSQLQVKLNFTTAYNGTLHLYAVDWDAYGGNRYETVTVNDGSGPRAIGLTSSFGSGAWIHVPIAVGAGGSVVVTVSKTGGYSAVLAGLFLGGGGTPPPPPTVPGAPTGLTATAGIARVALAWTAPANNGGSPITAYTATASPGGATCTTASLGCTITGLTGGTTYTFTVAATNIAGTGPASSPASATPQAPPVIPVDSPGVQGTWVGNYGVDGYVLSNWNGGGTDLTSLPAGVTFGLDKGARYLWANPTSDVRALTDPSGSNRQAETWYDVSQMQVHLTFTNAYSGTLHLYAVDWDAFGGNRYEDITIDDGSGPRVAHLSSSFMAGAWVHAPITVAAGGTVRITIDKTAGNTAVLSGLFLGGASTPPPPPVTIPVDSPGVQGTWVGNYGVDGYVLSNWNGGGTDLTSLPAGVTFGLDKGARYLWANPTSDVRALTDPSGSNRQAETWYDVSQMQVHLTFTNAYSGTLHLYAVDWDAFGGNRYEDITIDDGSGPRVAHLSSSFMAGAWVHAPITVAAGGTVRITIDKTAGNTAVLSGLFLGGASTPPPPPTVPGAPTGLTATAGNTQVALSWTAPASNGGSAITGYTVTASPGTGTCSSGGLGCTVTGLTNGTAYSFTVTATNAVGTGAASSPATATPATVPGAPTGLTATAGNAQVALSWTAPASNGGSAITGYTVTASPGTGTCTSTGLGCTVTGLTNGTAYSFTVSAANAIGTGAASSPANATPVGAPGAPTGLTATPGNTQVALSWTAPASNGGSPITGYTVTASPGTGTCTSTGLGCTVSGLVNGTAYTFTVKATNAVGTGPASSPATATPTAPPPPTVPGAPTGLTATAGNTQVALSWTAPASNGGSAITGYTVTASPGTGTCSSGGLGCTVTGLTNGTAYSFTVTATNAVGTGAASSPATATPATVPGAPTGLTATAGNAQVALSWTAPASNGGSAITGYKVYRSTSTGTETLLTTLGVVTSYTNTGLTNGTTYSFQVTAINAVGESARSAEASAKPVTVPSAPRNVTATRNATKGVTLAWTAPSSTGGSPISGYRIYRSTTSGTETFLVATGNVTSYVDTATTAGVRYFYKVAAVNAAGTGALSAEVNARAH